VSVVAAARFEEIPGWEWARRPVQDQALERVRQALESGPGLPITELAGELRFPCDGGAGAAELLVTPFAWLGHSRNP
jgi:hypothetical protein